MLCLQICLSRMSIVAKEARWELGSPGTRVAGNCQLPCRCWELKPDLFLEEQLSLRPPLFVVSNCVREQLKRFWVFLVCHCQGEEHDRWAVHSDSLQSHAGSQSQLACQQTHQPLESCCVSPDTQELADVHSVYTPSLAIQLEPSEEQRAKPVTDMSVSYSQKTK